MSTTTSKPALPPVRRVVTGHTTDGKSTVIRDEVQPPQFWSPGSINAIYDIGRTETIPANIDSEITTGEFIDEIATSKGHVGSTGAVFRSFDFAPGAVIPFHRTVSMDFGVIVKGQIVLQLDDDKKVTLNQGDAVVQRGTIHNWRNETDEWTRIFFVVMGAHPININGEELKEEWRKPK
ncbi:hypothetical protein D9758_006888 [Tetrapyrgos nigripes]|uniref:Cupin type-2 domain-containing protein n=1 Tax=Tetrapyrgos nigripes TaxID=182062 RepID=A0A8H5GSQ3_9AGAR|nr:hypothetical protein D9758_006888 [Tetrapyrgos nigripes]